MTKICKFCDKEFIPARGNQEYDSLACRRAEERRKLRLKGETEKIVAPYVVKYLGVVRNPTAAQLNAICNYYINASNLEGVFKFHGIECEEKEILPTLILGNLPKDWKQPDNIYINTIEPEKHVLS